MTGHIDSAFPFPSDSPRPSESPRRSGPSDSVRAPGAPAVPGDPAANAANAVNGPDGADVQPQVVLRGPAELVEALPYLLGFHPDDSVVMIGVHGDRGRFGARLRARIPADPGDWPVLASGAADEVINGAGPGRRPDAVSLFVCQDPRPGEAPAALMERLRPLVQHARRACGALDVPVVEAVCVSGGRWWSYLCAGTDCCPPDGTPVRRAGTSVMAATAAYAGIRVLGRLRDVQARLLPRSEGQLPAQRAAFDDASTELVPRMLLNDDTGTVRAETLTLASAALDRFRAAPTTDDAPGDLHDDALLGDDESATIVLGLQDRDTRDRAAEWMEPDDAPSALRLWRALARRCVGPYAGHAAAPLTLAGWVAWANGDDPTARIALGLALEADPDYTFARLLHTACNHGLDPEPLRTCLREERRTRSAPAPRPPRRAGAGAGAGPRGRADRAPRPPAGPRQADGGPRPRIRHGHHPGEEGTPC